MSRKLSNQEKVFRDSVHGYIRIPSVIVREIIDTPEFQRLRHIEQTSMRPLYPSARHDRFVHSLGVYHLGRKAFGNVRKSMPSGFLANLSSPCNDSGWWDKECVLFSLACLLHDCAHAPFSHTLERYYEVEQSGDLDCCRLDGEMVKEFDRGSGNRFRADYLDRMSKGCGAPHERMSALMVGRFFRERIDAVLSGLHDEGVLEEGYCSADESDVEFMARAIIGCRYGGSVSEKESLRNCFISLLNSSSIDVDALDYTMRDTLNSGLDNWSIDCERLLGSLKILETTTLHECDMSDIDLDGIWLAGARFQGRRSAGGDGSGLEVTGLATMTFRDENDANDVAASKRETPILCGGSRSVESKSDGEITSLRKMRQGYEVELRRCCRVKMEKWRGEASGTVLLGVDRMCGVCHGVNASRSFFLAYKKSSISVIQGVVDARNLFYRWVYAHPHVQYNSTFLQNFLLKMSAKYLCCRRYRQGFRLNGDLPPVAHDGCGCDVCVVNEGLGAPPGDEDAIIDILGLEGFYGSSDRSESSLGEDFAFSMATDDDLNALFKWVWLDNRRRGEGRSEVVEKYFGEYFSRTKKHLLWKSLEDRKHFFRTHDLPSVSFDSLANAGNSLSSNLYLFVEEDDEDMSRYFDQGYSNLIAVKVGMKMKDIDYSSTIVAFSGEVERMVDVMDSASERTAGKSDFLYLFSDAPASS